MEIKANSKLFDILNIYPQLEGKIMDLAPPFKNLKNPVLRKTVGKLATVDKVARIGNMEVSDLVNTLRREVGQAEIRSAVVQEIDWQEGEPEWIKGEPHLTIDGTEILSRGEHPLQKVNQLMRDLKKNDFIVLGTNFKPIPLIDEMEKQKYEVYFKTVKDQADQYLTFIRK